MFQKIISGSASGAGAKQETGKCSAFNVAAILIDVVVGGSAHVAADWKAHVANAVLRGKEDILIFNGTRIHDLLYFSDLIGGFSTELEGVDGTHYVALVPVGNIRLNGGDMIDMQIDVPGDATATYLYNVYAIEGDLDVEKILGYETILGTGANQFFSNALQLYFADSETPANISIKDQISAYTVLDTAAIALANARGQMEDYADFGLLWEDKSGLSQDLTVKLTSGKYGLLIKEFFPEERVDRKIKEADSDFDAFVNKIRLENPVKFKYLEKQGEI